MQRPSIIPIGPDARNLGAGPAHHDKQRHEPGRTGKEGGAAVLGGLDPLVFSGGVGEKAVEVRADICAGLESLGVHVDEERNAATAGDGIISPDGAPVPVVVSMDEEIVIAHDTYRIARKG